MKPLFNKISFDGLGTHWECEILDTECSKNKYYKVKNILVYTLNEFSKNYSRFDERSLVSKLNTESKLKYPSTEMCKMMRFASKMYYASDGVFNISIGGILSAKGYGKLINSADVNLDFWNRVVIADDLIEIPNGSIIDFGGFGKGWLIDKFKDIFNGNGIVEYIINGGGDLYVCSNKPVEIALEHPLDSTKCIGKTKISKGALAASSTIKRAWVYEKIMQHHIIDPVIGRSSNSNIISSFVKADTALIADVMATILIIRPDLDERLSREFNLKTILISNDQVKD